MWNRDRRTSRIMLPLAAALLLLLLLAACGGGNGAGETSTTPRAGNGETPTTPRATGNGDPDDVGITVPRATGAGEPSASESTSIPVPGEAAGLDRDVLVALYEATEGDGWTDNSNWLSEALTGQWHGVTVDDFGRVTALELRGNNLVGTVPEELTSLTGLTRLDLGGNRLTGCLPADLYAQDHVEIGRLGRAPNPPLAQTSPETDKEALIAIFEATDGETWDNSGTWAGLAPIGEWKGVTIDEDGRVVELKVHLGGAEIPPEIGHLTSLTTLDLNGVSGELPPELGYLENLGGRLEFGLNYGSNSGLSGEIPLELANLVNLAELDLSGNQLCGRLPPELGNLASLQVLNLAENNLSGRIPPELGNLAHLVELNLGSNQLTGELLPELGNLTNLRGLNLRINELSGEIPPEWENLAFNPVRFDLGGNQLDGCIPDLLNDLAAWISFRVRERVDAGEIPGCVPEGHPGDTETLIALHNAWGGKTSENWLSREPISEWAGVSVDATGRVVALRTAYPASGSGRPHRHNFYLDGQSLPPELGNLTSLQYLNLTGRGLTGEIPPELGNLANLQVLLLAGNNLTSGGRCVPNARTLTLPNSMFSPHGEMCGEFVSVSGATNGCGLKRDGSIVCWGYTPHPPVGEFASISLAGKQQCGVKTNGSIVCWGGTGTPPAGEFVSVNAGWQSACGVKRDGSVVCWSDRGPWSVTPPSGEFVSVSVGNVHGCGLKRDNSLACWGDADDEFDQATPPAGEFVSVSAGWRHTCGVKTDSSLVCWGWGAPSVAPVSAGEFVSVNTLESHTCGLKRDGSLACWGGGNDATPPAGEFVSVSPRNSSACGVRTNGSIACWGEGFDF